MKRLPTDLRVLNEVYERYYDTFAQYIAGSKTRDSKVYAPVDIAHIAESLKVDEDIVFGRLYYHLDKKYGYAQDDGSKVHLFTLVAGKDANCVNFPLVASVLADLRDQARKHRVSTWIAVGSLVVSLVSITIAILGRC